MPNNITNVLEFDCSEERFREIAEYLRGGSTESLGHVDFNTLIPMPKSLDIEAGSRGEQGFQAYKKFIAEASRTKESKIPALEAKYKAKFEKDPETWELGKQYFENIRDYGAPNWYDWCCNHWNTKWNAYDCVPIDPSDKMLIFETAWDSVPPIVEALSRKFPDIEISYGWADEDIGYNVGRLSIKDGKVLSTEIYEGGSREAYEQAAAIMGDDLSEWGLVLSEDGKTYEYHEDDSFFPANKEEKSHSGDAR